MIDAYKDRKYTRLLQRLMQSRQSDLRSTVDPATAANKAKTRSRDLVRPRLSQSTRAKILMKQFQYSMMVYTQYPQAEISACVQTPLMYTKKLMDLNLKEKNNNI